jgi:hypothetical protein
MNCQICNQQCLNNQNNVCQKCSTSGQEYNNMKTNKKTTDFISKITDKRMSEYSDTLKEKQAIPVLCAYIYESGGEFKTGFNFSSNLLSGNDLTILDGGGNNKKIEEKELMWNFINNMEEFIRQCRIKLPN